MTMPADITTEASWDRLIYALRAQYDQVDDLYQRITAPEEDADEQKKPERKEPEMEEPMPDPRTYPHPGYDRDAELEREEQERRDAETDGRLDGDYDIDPYDAPGLED